MAKALLKRAFVYSALTISAFTLQGCMSATEPIIESFGVVGGVEETVVLDSKDSAILDGKTIRSYQWVKGYTTYCVDTPTCEIDTLSEGTHTITLVAVDSDGSQVFQNYIVTIESVVNKTPVAEDIEITLEEGETKTIVLSGNDADEDTLSYELLTFPAHGALSGEVPNLIYTAANGYTGADSLTYVVNDGQEDSEVATVNITITEKSTN